MRGREGGAVASPRQLGERGPLRALHLRPTALHAVVSGLVLTSSWMPGAAVAGMADVTVPGGAVGGNVWDDSGRMEMLRLSWDVATALDPSVARRDEGPWFPSCRPEVMNGVFRSAELQSVEVVSLGVPTVFADFDDYWRPFLGGTGPAPAYVASFGDGARDGLRERLCGGLAPARRRVDHAHGVGVGGARGRGRVDGFRRPPARWTRRRAPALLRLRLPWLSLAHGRCVPLDTTKRRAAAQVPETG